MIRIFRLLAAYTTRAFLQWTAFRSFLFTLVFNQAVSPLIGLALWSAVLPGETQLSTYFIALLAVQLMTVSQEYYLSLIHILELRRVYFGAFRPVAGTPLHAMPATPFVREQRLREADWLLRNYGFEQQELPYSSAGNLPLHIDPKLAWALAHPELFPVELNTADESRLLRIPGLGPIAVRRILRLRAEQRFRDLQHLHTLGAAARRASDFVTLDGKYFGRSVEERLRYYNREGVIAEQLHLWE